MRLIHRARTRIVAAMAVCAAAALLPTVAFASPARHASAAPPRCREARTLVWLALAPEGAAGIIYYPVEFTNLGAHACSLYGFPGVSAINKSGHQIGPPASRAAFSHQPVTLGPGQTAFARLGITQPGIIGGCRAATAAGLRVYPPSQKSATRVESFTFPACTNKVFMYIYPVQAGIGVP